jgi:hypothetical protein
VTRLTVVLACAAVVLAGPDPSVAPTGPATAAPAAPAVRYAAPLDGPVVIARPFRAPAGPYAAGHRGVDLTATPGQTVLAAGTGRVRFAGLVAGRGVVVIEHADGVVTEYEPVATAVRVGTAVTRAQPIATVRGTHGGCAPGRCLHWGARRDGAYFDPMTLLARLGPVRLLPWAGGPGARRAAIFLRPGESRLAGQEDRMRTARDIRCMRTPEARRRPARGVRRTRAPEDRGRPDPGVRCTLAQEDRERPARGTRCTRAPEDRGRVASRAGVGLGVGLAESLH